MKAIIFSIGLAMTIIGVVIPVTSSVTGFMMDTKEHALTIFSILVVGLSLGAVLIKKSNI
jgi:hypothetical protein